MTSPVDRPNEAITADAAGGAAAAGEVGPLVLTHERISAAVAECTALGPWTRESVDLMLALGGRHAPCTEPHHEDHEGQASGEHMTFDACDSVVFLGHRLTVHTSGWHDPTVEDPNRWFWFIDVWTDYERLDGMLVQWRPESRDEVLTLLTGIHNLCALTGTS